MRVGLVSDSHGLADPAVPRLFARCALVLHAGDVVKPEVLEPLRRVAPLVAVRGNNDAVAPLARLPEAALVPLGELTALLVHDLGARERPKPPARELLARRAPEIVVHGHSHRPGAAVFEGRLFVNPGSAGPRRFSLPRAAGILSLRGRRVTVELFALSGPRPTPLAPPLVVTL
jgi:putative phosphoesterase